MSPLDKVLIAVSFALFALVVWLIGELKMQTGKIHEVLEDDFGIKPNKEKT